MATKLLLIQDQESLGRSGDVVSVKPGYARNFLLPQGVAVIANKKTLIQQERLKAEREKQAAEDKKESEGLAANLEGITLTKIVKVDHEGHMYGSVTAHDVADLLQEQHNIELDKKNVQLKHAIKSTGVHAIPLKLKEGVVASITLKVMSEEGFRASQEEQTSEE